MFIVTLGPADAWDELIGHSLREGGHDRPPGGVTQRRPCVLRSVSHHEP